MPSGDRDSGVFGRPRHRIIKGVPDMHPTRSPGPALLPICIGDDSPGPLSAVLPQEAHPSCRPLPSGASACCQTPAAPSGVPGPAARPATISRSCVHPAPGHIRTGPGTSRARGRAGRFMQTALREQASAAACPTSPERRDRLPVCWMIHAATGTDPTEASRARSPSADLAWVAATLPGPTTGWCVENPKPVSARVLLAAMPAPAPCNLHRRSAGVTRVFRTSVWSRTGSPSSGLALHRVTRCRPSNT